MHCPSCQTHDTKVIDSRLLQEGANVRRRRKCDSCGHRFTTYEKFEVHFPTILKRDGRRENFNPKKIMGGLEKAFQKRPISTDNIENILSSLETFLLQLGQKEYHSEQIGTFLMNKINELDTVAFVRFASFYWNYDNIDSFVKGLTNQALKFNRLSSIENSLKNI